MNINSISELSPVVEEIISASNKAQLTAVAQEYYRANDISGSSLSNLAELGFNTLSCGDMNVEVSITEAGKLQSKKFNLGKALNDISKTLAWIAYLNSAGITKDEADELYVPYSGNIGENKKSISGLHIVPPNNNENTALSVEKNAVFSNADNTDVIFEIIATGATPTVKATECTIDFAAASCNVGQLSATTASCNALSAGLYTIGSGSDWNMKVDYGISNGSSFPKPAIFTQLSCANLSSTLLSTGNCSVKTSLVVAQSDDDSSMQFAVDSYGVSANHFKATNLCAGLNNDDSYKLSVLSGIGAIKIANLEATNLCAGISSNSNQTVNVLEALSDKEYLTLHKLKVSADSGLTAAGISELTAKAACWS